MESQYSNTRGSKGLSLSEDGDDFLVVELGVNGRRELSDVSREKGLKVVDYPIEEFSKQRNVTSLLTVLSVLIVVLG